MLSQVVWPVERALVRDKQERRPGTHNAQDAHPPDHELTLQSATAMASLPAPSTRQTRPSGLPTNYQFLGSAGGPVLRPGLITPKTLRGGAVKHDRLVTATRRKACLRVPSRSVTLR